MEAEFANRLRASSTSMSKMPTPCTGWQSTQAPSRSKRLQTCLTVTGEPLGQYLADRDHTAGRRHIAASSTALSNSAAHLCSDLNLRELFCNAPIVMAT